MPVCSGTVTDFRVTTPEASRSMGMVAVVWMGPLPSMGLPRASMTRPSISSPAGTSARRPVRRTRSPSSMPSSGPSRAQPTLPVSRFMARARTPFSNSKSSPYMTFSRPYTVAIPSPT